MKRVSYIVRIMFEFGGENDVKDWVSQQFFQSCTKPLLNGTNGTLKPVRSFIRIFIFRLSIDSIERKKDFWEPWRYNKRESICVSAYFSIAVTWAFTANRKLIIFGCVRKKQKKFLHSCRDIIIVDGLFFIFVERRWQCHRAMRLDRVKSV